MTATKFDFCDQLQQGCAVLGIDLDGAAVERLGVYFAELVRWSQKINLIAKGAADFEIVENHFLDSLTLLPLLVTAKNPHLLDVGTGAGFPGLVCKAAMPALAVTLLEPRLKRVSFLRHIIRSLHLGGVEVIAGRIEDEVLLPSTTRFTHITSRAVADMGEFLAMVGRLCHPQTTVICMKGPKWQEELHLLHQKQPSLPLRHSATREFQLPTTQAHRALLSFSR